MKYLLFLFILVLSACGGSSTPAKQASISIAIDSLVVNADSTISVIKSHDLTDGEAKNLDSLINRIERAKSDPAGVESRVLIDSLVSVKDTTGH